MSHEQICILRENEFCRERGVGFAFLGAVNMLLLIVDEILELMQEFPGGITNGNNWYPVYGGMQDWNYINVHCFELTLELSDEKGIAPSQLSNHWIENREAMVIYPIAATLGILSGVVIKDVSGEPLKARIVVEGIRFDIFSETTFGNYYRILAPGNYKVTAEADGYESKVANVNVPREWDKGVVQDFYLREL